MEGWSGAEILLLEIRGCQRCGGKHMVVMDQGYGPSGSWYETYGMCPDCVKKVNEFVEPAPPQ